MNLKPVDLLFTFDWPSLVTEHSSSAPKVLETAESKLLNSLTSQLQPRYHFAISEDLFWEREPYENLDSSGNFFCATRFISLGNVGDKRVSCALLFLNIWFSGFMQCT